MSKLFHIVDECRAILRCKGVFRQANVYERNGELHAAWGTGFVGLRRDGHTTAPNISVVDIETPRGTTIACGKYGVLILARPT